MTTKSGSICYRFLQQTEEYFQNHTRYFVGLLTCAWGRVFLPSPVCSAFSGHVPNGELSLTSSGHHAYSGGYRPGFSPDSLVQPTEFSSAATKSYILFWHKKRSFLFGKTAWIQNSLRLPRGCSLMYDHCRLMSHDEHGLSRRTLTGL